MVPVLPIGPPAGVGRAEAARWRIGYNGISGRSDRRPHRSGSVIGDR